MAASNLSGSILSIDYQDYADCRVVSVTGRVDHTNSTQFLDNLSAHAEEAGHFTARPVHQPAGLRRLGQKRLGCYDPIHQFPT